MSDIKKKAELPEGKYHLPKNDDSPKFTKTLEKRNTVNKEGQVSTTQEYHGSSTDNAKSEPQPRMALRRVIRKLTPYERALINEEFEETVNRGATPGNGWPVLKRK